MPPLVFVQNRGDEDWIDKAAEELSSLHIQLSFVGERKAPSSQRFGSTALGAGGQATPRNPLHTVSMYQTRPWLHACLFFFFFVIMLIE